MLSSTATLSLSPWAAQALSLAEEKELAERAVRLHCRMGVIKGRACWNIAVSSWAMTPTGPLHRISLREQRGHLADLMHGALDAYELAYVYTPGELATIQMQDGAA